MKNGIYVFNFEYMGTSSLPRKFNLLNNNLLISATEFSIEIFNLYSTKYL